MRLFTILMIGIFAGDVCAMDIIKTFKVTEEPKPFYHRKMDQAIRVQFSQDSIHQYLKKKNHPCCH